MTKNCKCGHSHISFVGDLGENKDEPGYQLIDECEKCDCEKYEPKNYGKICDYCGIELKGFWRHIKDDGYKAVNISLCDECHKDVAEIIKERAQ